MKLRKVLRFRMRAESILYASRGELRRQMGYKTVWRRMHLAMADRFHPSSQTRRVCGGVNPGLPQADRSGTCVCGIFEDCELNAARNLRS